MNEILKEAFGENYNPEKIEGVMGVSNIEEIWKDLYKAYKFNIRGNLLQRDKIIQGQELTELIFRFIGMFIGSERLTRYMDILGDFSRSILQKNKSEFHRFANDDLLPNLEEKLMTIWRFLILSFQIIKNLSK